MDRNAMHISSNWTGRAPRTVNEAFPRTVRRFRPTRRIDWGKLGAFAGAATAGAALGAIAALMI